MVCGEPRTKAFELPCQIRFIPSEPCIMVTAHYSSKNVFLVINIRLQRNKCINIELFYCILLRTASYLQLNLS
jgi:hypothetical protein